MFNFLPPRLRFKYILLVNAFNNQTQHLCIEGLKLKFHNYDKEFIIKFVPLCVIADALAKAILQNRLQYNGYCSCSFCYHIGRYIKDAGVRFPFLDKESELRTHNSHLEDVANVEKLILSSKLKKNVKPSVRGVKGFSAFIQQHIDMVWAFPIDYMHNAILGVTEQVWVEINKNDQSPKQRKEVDKLLLQIQPPHDLYRIPERISSKGIWKATHWKSWLLYYSIPILFKFELFISKVSLSIMRFL